MKHMITVFQEDKLEWQTPNLEMISTENTENLPTGGDDGLGDGS